MSEYDICIIGAGVSGLYCALELKKRFPRQSVVILERKAWLGGRIFTFHDEKRGLSWESGAGRVHKTHEMTLGLLKKYGLHTIPISPEIDWRTPGAVQPTDFPTYLKNFPIEILDKETLGHKTLGQILSQTLGPTKANDLLSQYEYTSEMDTLRADRGLANMSYELGDHDGFFVIKEGFSALIDGMEKDVKKAGIEIRLTQDVQDIQYKAGVHTIEIKGLESIKAKKVIIAVSRDAVAELPCFKGLPLVDYVKMRPLVRIYAVFPTKNGKAWFDGMAKFVCPPPLRFVIPMSSEKGTIMISYTDGDDTEFWLRPRSEKALQDALMSPLRKLFPDLHIPDPTFIKVHPWPHGCSYWLPGDYSVEEMSKASIKPLAKSMPNLYMCGESWATVQCWVECALQQGRKLLKEF